MPRGVTKKAGTLFDAPKAERSRLGEFQVGASWSNQAGESSNSDSAEIKLATLIMVTRVSPMVTAMSPWTESGKESGPCVDDYDEEQAACGTSSVSSSG